mmetsp:Transcript_1161/g.4331  ORF Transcript_1161/g.4331 Transcript_1161/m.4331 type:complete len:272 (-) Transcript_1161:2199-3014(-)
MHTFELELLLRYAHAVGSCAQPVPSTCCRTLPASVIPCSKLALNLQLPLASNDGANLERSSTRSDHSRARSGHYVHVDTICTKTDRRRCRRIGSDCAIRGGGGNTQEGLRRNHIERHGFAREDADEADVPSCQLHSPRTALGRLLLLLLHVTQNAVDDCGDRRTLFGVSSRLIWWRLRRGVVVIDAAIAAGRLGGRCSGVEHRELINGKPFAKSDDAAHQAGVQPHENVRELYLDLRFGHFDARQPSEEQKRVRRQIALSFSAGREVAASA